eukprot:CAMPEP_0197625526 /NCGR_PEP_ID=MMETSP1338-20131121/4869_1 /TAXON_ID=43686 ORGANISM="Pelagodinium beii, Strain RCC1491" /NCGR_SAMPLE_ID=MMETSP1338 /ASSEMBLY_ACC=CAM_ASM_000754 /LENGTH=417 /DNA_ID=CAMNT_0043195957 /DNA_START=60 /DNA_END=1310 /DNA_ORIENTATION=+
MSKGTFASLEDELHFLREERQSLLAALGQDVGERPWPAPGELVRMAADWDGVELFGEDTACLFLQRGQDVRVSFISDEGWLWGTVAGGKQSGWFGGPGCSAVRKISIDVPLGPTDPSSVPPMLPPEIADPEVAPEVQDYIDRHGIDARTQEALKELSADLQLSVIEADLVNCRNPSAVLLSRIRSMKSAPYSAQARSAGPGPPAVAVKSERHQSRSRSPRRQAQAEAEVEDFIVRHGLDEAAAQALRILPGHMQQEVMNTDLNNCRNPSAVLMGRVRSLEAGASRNGTSSWQDSSQDEDSVEAFIEQHGLDEAATVALRSLPLSAQVKVIQVELRNVRNPSAVVNSRVREYQQTSQSGRGGANHSRLSKEVEDYIRHYGLDERVATDLRQLPPEAQRSVIESEIVNARNPSAVVTKR